MNQPNPNASATIPVPAEKRTVKKLTIVITDPEAVLSAYPGVKLVVTKETIDRKKLRPIVNALHDIGAQVPGVRAFYASEEAENTASTPAA